MPLLFRYLSNISEQSTTEQQQEIIKINLLPDAIQQRISDV